jgi:hypothetical protein
MARRGLIGSAPPTQLRLSSTRHTKHSDLSFSSSMPVPLSIDTIRFSSFQYLRDSFRFIRRSDRSPHTVILPSTKARSSANIAYRSARISSGPFHTTCMIICSVDQVGLLYLPLDSRTLLLGLDTTP